MRSLARAFVAAASILAAQAADARWTLAEATVYGSRVTVEIWSNRSVPDELAAQAIDEYVRVRRLTDTDNLASELSQVNARAPTEAVEIGAELFVFLDLALQIAARTEGVVDPTSVSPVFRGDSSSPNDDRTKVSYRDVILDKELSTIRFAAPDVRLDSTALAPAHALAAACEWLRMRGVLHARIATRGIVCHIGDRRGKEWSLGVGTLSATARKIVRLSVTNAAVVSVGGIRLFNEDKLEYLTPPTPDLVNRDLRTATVFGQNAMIAAGLAYMILERGPVLGFENLLAYPGYDAFVFDWAGEVAHTFTVDMKYSDR